MDHLSEYNRDSLSKMIKGERKVSVHFLKKQEPPFDTIDEDDTLYLSTINGITIAKAKINEVEHFKNLTPEKAKNILSEHEEEISPNDLMWERDIYRKYLTMIWLEDVQEISPFTVTPKYINKKWVSTEDINRIRD